NRRPHEEPHEPEADVVLLLEGVLVLVAQLHHGGQVGLVEGREGGGGLLRLDQPLRNAAAQGGHLLARLSAGGGRLRCGGGGRLRRRPSPTAPPRSGRPPSRWRPSRPRRP